MENDTLNDATFYSESVYMRVIITIRIPFASLAVVLLSVLHFNRNKFVAHRSLTVLLNWHFLWTYLTCLATIVDHAYTVFILV
ncbi:hypothetical protein PFISCL1PPCAC_17840, partial [Pristionchus fissidentatus]